MLTPKGGMRKTTRGGGGGGRFRHDRTLGVSEKKKRSRKRISSGRRKLTRDQK